MITRKILSTPRQAWQILNDTRTARCARVRVSPLLTCGRRLEGAARAAPIKSFDLKSRHRPGLRPFRASDLRSTAALNEKMSWKIGMHIFIVAAIISIPLMEITRSIVHRQREKRLEIAGTQDIVLWGISLFALFLICAIVCGIISAIKK